MARANRNTVGDGYASNSIEDSPSSYKERLKRFTETIPGNEAVNMLRLPHTDRDRFLNPMDQKTGFTV